MRSDLHSDERRRLTLVRQWLHVVIVGSLALYLVIGVVAWSWMLLTGRAVPGAFATILASIAGGLVGVLSPGRRTGGAGVDASVGDGQA